MCRFFQTCFKFSKFYMYIWHPLCQDLLLPQYIQWLCCSKVSSLQPQTCYQHTEIQTPYQRSSLAKLSTHEDRSQGMLLGAIDQHLTETAQQWSFTAEMWFTNLLWCDFIFITSSNDILKKCKMRENLEKNSSIFGINPSLWGWFIDL